MEMMNNLEKKYINLINDRYSKRLDIHGTSPKTLGWASSAQQVKRFERYQKYLLPQKYTIADIGCGFGDFASFLGSSSISIPSEYIGVDINPNLLEVAALSHHDFKSTYLCGDILDKTFNQSLGSLRPDIVVAAGIFNFNFYANQSKMHNFFYSMLDSMLSLKPYKIIFDFIPADRSDSYLIEDYIAVYDLPEVISFLNARGMRYILDLNQPPNPMTEALLVVDLQ